MAVYQVTYFSTAIARFTQFTMVVPNDTPVQMKEMVDSYKRPMKVLMLLHGYNGCCTDWMYGSNVQDMAMKYNMAIIMPNGENSFYLNGKGTGKAYETYVGEELIQYVRDTFHIALNKEDTYIGGVSMGGYGAIHTALNHSDVYGKAFGLSSAVIVPMLKDMTPDMDSPIADYEYYVQVFGDLNKVAETHINPLVQVRLLNEAGKDIPPLYLACGTEDFGYEMNTKFAEDLKQAGVDVEFHCGSGQHNWAFWNTWFEPAIKWLLK